MSVDAILKEVAALSVGERLVLFDRLREVYPEPEPAVELSDELKAELDRRIAAADANPGAGIPWEVVLAESLKRAKS